MTKDEALDLALPCCGYTDASAVKWNPFNGVVQCHNCGQTYTPPAQPAPVQEMTNIQRHEQNVQKFLAAQPAPVQEPVAWLQIGLAPFHDGDVIARTSKPKAWNPEWWRFEPLYTTPPAAPVQGLVNQRALTVDELITLEQKHRRHEDLSRAIEQRLKEKNT